MINIKQIEPLTEEEVQELNLNYDKIVKQIASFDGYFARIAVEKARLEVKLGEAKVKVQEITTVMAVLSNYNDIAKSRVAGLKSIKADFPKARIDY